jgi:uncharacterized protein (DUF952 family)
VKISASTRLLQQARTTSQESFIHFSDSKQLVLAAAAHLAASNVFGFVL